MSLESITKNVDAEYEEELTAVHKKHASKALNALRDYVLGSGLDWGDARIEIISGNGTATVLYNDEYADSILLADLGGIDTYVDDNGDECDAYDDHPQNIIPAQKRKILKEIENYVHGGCVGNTCLSSNWDWNCHLNGKFIYRKP